MGVEEMRKKNADRKQLASSNWDNLKSRVDANEQNQPATETLDAMLERLREEHLQEVGAVEVD